MADLDVVVVGAGFAGIYAVHALRSSGLTVRAFEAGGGIGGTWFWNSYPGARCDVESKDYSFSFSPELEQEWSWSERYPAQPEILRYLSHVADRFELWPHIQLNTRVTAARWDDDAAQWTVTTDDGAMVSARFFVSAVGCLSAYQVPSLPGLETFSGSWHHTARWGRGRRLRREAGRADRHRVDRDPGRARDRGRRVGALRVPADAELRGAEPESPLGAGGRARVQVALPPVPQGGAGVVPRRADHRDRASGAERADRRRAADVQRTVAGGGGMPFLGAYTDLLVDQAANDVIAEFMRDRIRETVEDPAVAELLCPRTFPVGSKRLCQSDDYYAMYNRPNVTLVDLRSTPLTSASAGGLSTTSAFYELDAIVFATGFDAISGALRQIDVRGVSGVALADRGRPGRARTWGSPPRASRTCSS